MVKIKIPKSKQNKKNKLEQDKVIPDYWISQNDKRFPNWINKTFIKYKLTENSIISNKDFKPFKYQLFLRDYMQHSSPYRGILLYHGLGSGKTCSAITIAENLKKDRNIIVISPASLKNNFIGDSKTGLLFCGDKEYNDDIKSINKYYTFISSNASNTIQQMNSISFDNSVIIIDEVHNLISRIVGGLSGDNKQGKMIYKKLLQAKNCKIIALSGTPIVNNIYEIAILFNILRGYLYVSIFKIESMTEKYDILKLNEEFKTISEIFHMEINMKNKTIEFYLSIPPYNNSYQTIINSIIIIAKKNNIILEYNVHQEYTLFPDEGDNVGKIEFEKNFTMKNKNEEKLKNIELFKRRILGLVSYYKSKEENLPKIIKNEIIKVEMSNYQFEVYQKARAEEKISHKLAEIRVFSRQFSNFAFPPDIIRPGIGDKIAKKNKNKEDNENSARLMHATESDEYISEVKKDELQKYHKKIIEALYKLTEDSDKYLIKDKLDIYSNKMKKMLDIVENTKGLVFIYSDFRSLEGIEIFSRILDANGYSKYGNNKSGYKYALYTGTEDYNERSKIISIFNNIQNRNGDEIKIIMVTAAGSEGLDLKNIRSVLIMEPYWNNVRIQQVIGRAVRRNSHIDLPENERNVSIYRFLSIISYDNKKNLKLKDQMSTDEVILDIANKKEYITKEMLHLLKETSVDCVLNAYDNNENIECFNFGENPEGIAFMPKLGKDLSRGVESETRNIEIKLRHGAISKDNFVYFIQNKKVYKVDNILQSIDILPKFKQKVAIDLDKKEVYDHDVAIRSKLKIIIGTYDDNGKFSVKN